jgi:hypothetical protein
MNVQSYWTPQKGKVNNKQNDLKQEFLFLKDPPLNLRESGSKYGPPTYDELNLYSPLRFYNSTISGTEETFFLFTEFKLQF